VDFTDPKAGADLVLTLRDRFHMDDDRFGRLHDFFHRRPERIQVFVDYCLRTRRFQPGGSNEVTFRRLALCLERLQAGDTWTVAMVAALKTYPIPR
jgi:hypothetical protein